MPCPPLHFITSRCEAIKWEGFFSELRETNGRHTDLCSACSSQQKAWQFSYIHVLFVPRAEHRMCHFSRDAETGTHISGWEGAQTMTCFTHRAVPLELDCFAGNSLIWSHHRWLKICLHTQIEENEQKIAIIWERPGQ